MHCRRRYALRISHTAMESDRAERDVIIEYLVTQIDETILSIVYRRYTLINSQMLTSPRPTCAMIQRMLTVARLIITFVNIARVSLENILSKLKKYPALVLLAC